MQIRMQVKLRIRVSRKLSRSTLPINRSRSLWTLLVTKLLSSQAQLQIRLRLTQTKAKLLLDRMSLNVLLKLLMQLKSRCLFDLRKKSTCKCKWSREKTFRSHWQRWMLFLKRCEWLSAIQVHRLTRHSSCQSHPSRKAHKLQSKSTTHRILKSQARSSTAT